MSLHRKKIADILGILSQPGSDVILLEGPRQVGKTTIAKMCLESAQKPHLSINLERDLRYRAAIDRCQSFQEFTDWLKDEFEFVPDGSKILFIDEAQESRQLGRFVRFMKEDWQSKTILTGSMMIRLFHDDIRYPVGRVHTLTIQPFTFFEFLTAFNRTDLLDAILNLDSSPIAPMRHDYLLSEVDSYLKSGGLPEILKHKLAKQDFKDTLTEIYENYRQDFMRVYGQDQGHLFERALLAVADHVGSPSKITQALPANDKNYSKMAAVFSRLESWHMIHTSAQRGPVPEGTTQFHPKRYLFDLGILSQLRTMALPDLSTVSQLNPSLRTLLGGIIENFAALHLAFLNFPLYGFRKASAGMEIDFILKINDITIPVECKAALKLKETHLTGIKTYLKEYNLKTGIVINLAPFEVRKYPFGKIISLPVYALEYLRTILARHL